MKKELKNIFLLGWMIIFSSVLFSQNVPAVKAEKASSENLLFPWAGGMNSIQFGSVDINRDGIKDLVAFDRQGDRIMCFINSGKPNTIDYQLEQQYVNCFPSLYYWAIFADYDHDGKTDIFTYSPGWASIIVYRNVSTGDSLRFERVIYPYLVSQTDGGRVNLYVTYADYPGIVDLDGDGDLDILSFWGLGSFVEMNKNMSEEKYGNADSLDYVKTEYCWGHFAESEESNALFLDSCVSGAQKADTLSPRLLKTAQEERHTGSTFCMLDLNEDGVQDLLLGDVDYPGLFALINGGTKDSAVIISYDTLFPDYGDPIRLYSMPAASYIDVNNDGIKDLLVSPFDPGLYVSQNKHSVWLFLNSGKNDKPYFNLVTKNFLQDQMIDAGSGAYPVFYDWNHDGKMDLFLGNYGTYQRSYYDRYILHSVYYSQIVWYENIGTLQEPVFQPQELDFGDLFQHHWIGLYPAFADLNGDGLTDMLVGNSNGNLIYLQNTGNNTFTIVDTNYQGIQVKAFSAPVLFDLDKDGLPDLIIGQKAGNLTYYHNDGPAGDPHFSLVTDSLGKINVTDYNLSYDGYSTPCFYRDAQGYTRLVVGSEQGKLFYYSQIDGNLDGKFTESDSLGFLLDTTGVSFDRGIRTAAAMADINGDGKPEMVAGNFSGGLEFFHAQPEAVTDVSNISFGKKLIIMPNPARDFIRFMLPEKESQLSVDIFSADGKKVFSGKILPVHNLCEIDVHHLTGGLYFLKATGLHNNYSGKFVVIQHP
ncbi:T9SS type A sorting domain-containing protein [Candidatus Sulfidibacterium hydrothermale]|uniref:FG-GAP-like repeat-containing protein n=1 Tax=Candidatus Sulfidibacterium hydrothermale TaxID=2875962 RepID=UPI001F0B3D20|nr:FG-GAP-like repeat-containing protein [Candidatus Sulfidibacterium hydrothermale]UBM62925.1 T9SS type A sorting domain-containing protein [Candidatus Sulfidibacterium hydrothermale]